jgi:hypothetical protein
MQQHSTSAPALRFTTRAPVLTAICLITLTVAGAGCIPKFKIDLDYAPSARLVLSELEPTTFLLSVKDSRPANERDRIAHQRSSFGGKIKRMPLYVGRVDVTDAIYEAFKAELELNGHSVVKDSEEPVDAYLSVEIKRYLGEIQLGQDGEMRVLIQVVIEPRRSMEQEPLRLEIQGSSTTKRHPLAIRWGMGAIQEGFDACLADLMRNFALDHRVIAALEPDPNPES